MQLHKRQMLLLQANSSFGLAWIKALDAGKVETHEDANFVSSQIDAFWINASRKNLPIAAAVDAWNQLDTSSIEFGQIVRAAGDKLLKLIQENELTHGEINSILTSARSSDAKYQLRVERNPENPNEPSGLA